MRKARCVMLMLLSTACSFAFSQAAPGGGADSLDREITVIGRDETALPIPLPWKQENVSLPSLDVEQPSPPRLPAIMPPAGEWSAPTAELKTIDPLSDKMS
jgi:hypothetical protein